MTVGVKRERTTKVSSKNQVTLPVAALRAAGVGPGDVLVVEVVSDGVFRLARQRDPWWEPVHDGGIHAIGRHPRAARRDAGRMGTVVIDAGVILGFLNPNDALGTSADR